MESQLDEIPGIGAERKKILLKHFGSILRMRRASIASLMEVSGIGRQMAELIRAELNRSK